MAYEMRQRVDRCQVNILIYGLHIHTYLLSWLKGSGSILFFFPPCILQIHFLTVVGST